MRNQVVKGLSNQEGADERNAKFEDVHQNSLCHPANKRYQFVSLCRKSFMTLCEKLNNASKPGKKLCFNLFNIYQK